MIELASDGVVVDTSAAVAVLLGEPGSAAIVEYLEDASQRLMSVATRVELGLVIEGRLGSAGIDVVSRLLRDAEIELVDVDADTAERALSAWRRYGKGRHRAGLNFGDCFGYALAERSGLPLLCIGNDFAATDLEVRRPADPSAETSRRRRRQRDPRGVVRVGPASSPSP